MTAALRDLFGARHIAIVGASERSGWTRFLLDNLRAAPRTGRVVTVHRRRESVAGVPVFGRLAELDQPIDLAFLLTGPATAPAVIEEAASVGVRHAVVLAAGFREQGNEHLEGALVETARRLGVTVLGPNGIGFVNAVRGVAPFALPFARPLVRGGVGVVLQSGGLASTVLDIARAQGVGISVLASTGNEAMVTAADIMEYHVEDEDTRVVALFLEGIRDPARFLRLADRAAALGKPVVVFKVGRSPGVRRSALAHTGAVVGDDAVVDAALRQAGVCRVESLEELVVTAGLLASARPPAGSRMGVVTDSGGANDLIGDGAFAYGIDVPELSTPTRAALAAVVPSFGHADNPVDVTGVGLAAREPGELLPIDRALAAVVRDPAVDFAIHTGIVLPERQPSRTEHDALYARLRQLSEILDTSPVPVVNVGYGNDVGPYARQVLADHGIHLVRGIDLAMKAIGNAVRWAALREGRTTGGGPRDWAAWTPAIGEPVVWSEDQARRWLAAAGVPVVPGRLVTSADEAVALAAEFAADGRDSVVLKVCSADIAHKSDVGGVALDVRGAPAVRAAFDRVLAAGRSTPGAHVEGVLVTAMRRGGVELVVGVTPDESFGPVLTVGLGGVWVEVLRDTAHRVLPVEPSDVKAALDGLRAAPLLRGARGSTPVDLDRVAAVVSHIAAAAAGLGPHLAAVEVNPLWVDGDRVEALDALVATVGEQR